MPRLELVLAGVASHHAKSNMYCIAETPFLIPSQDGPFRVENLKPLSYRITAPDHVMNSKFSVLRCRPHKGG